MLFRAKKLNQKGYTLIELAIATAILAAMATTVIMANRFVNKQAVQNADQTFATEKAIQMYEEMRALVNGNEELGVGVLDDYSNFANYDKVLTTDIHVDTGLASANPGDPLSGNIKTDGNWRYMRQVEVNRVANDTYARQVTVKVFLYGGDLANQNKPGMLLATVGGILRTSAAPYQPTQVMDLYILQINNIPSWWAVEPTLAGYMQSDVADLASRLQGLQLRTHYVTRTSYGRDFFYEPSTNSIANGSEVTPQQWVYFYPGFVPQDSGSDNWYYDPQTSGDPNSLVLDGNIKVDNVSYPVSNTQFSNSTTTMNVNYSVADQYNNAMRYPDELAAYYAVTQAAAAFASTQVGGVIQQGVTEISERMLMEGMLSKPQSFENAMIVNLHGELLPLPPMRNYSDAAKDPGNQLSETTNPPPMTCNITSPTTGNANVRVVTHPELLYYPGTASNSSSVTVRLRVYAYYDSEDTGGVLPSGDPRVPAISLFLPDSSARVVGVTAIVGNASSPLTYSYQSPPGPYTAPYSGIVPNDDPAANAMSMAISLVGGGDQTLITLYNTPLRCGEAVLPTPAVVGEVVAGSGSSAPNAQVVRQASSQSDNDVSNETGYRGNAVPQGAPNTHTPTNTRTNTVTNTFTKTFTGTPTKTNTATNTITNTPTITYTPTATFTNGPCTIAYTSAATFVGTTNSSSPASFPMTVSGAFDLLLVQSYIQANGFEDSVKTCTYAGQAMTRAVGFTDVTGGHPDVETWYLTNPTTGTNNVIVTINDTSSQTIDIGAICYEGVNQTTPIGAVTYISDQSSSDNHSITITTTVDDSWIASTMFFNGNSSISTGVGQNQRWQTIGGTTEEGDDLPTSTRGYHLLTYSCGISHSADLEAVEILPCYIGPTPTVTNTAIIVNTPTLTNTPTVTTTSTPTPGQGGLNSADMLYGEEYIPCSPVTAYASPTQVAFNSTNYVNNTYTFGQDLTSGLYGSGYPKNTARWIISIAMPVTSVFANAQTINGVPYAAGATIAGQHSIETRLGNAVTTSAVTITNGASTMPITIYPNLSRTYVWTGDSFMPPYTEQYQFMGDPRDCPYLDVEVGGVSIANAAITIAPNSYNWWFKNGSSGQGMNADGYTGFGASGNKNSWNGDVGSSIQVDMPRYYQMIRQGLLNTSSIWTTTNGFSFYYYGMGGEIGFDQSPMSSGVKIMSYPFQKTHAAGSAVYGYNDILNDTSTQPGFGGLWVASNITGSNSVTWYQRSWLGELYPDASYSQWQTYGNLPSVANTTGSLPETFYLENMENVHTAGPLGNSDDGFNGKTYLPNPGTEGCQAFFNGYNGSANNTFNHDWGSGPATETTESVTTYNIYPFPLPNTVEVSRPWYFGGSNGSLPDEWNTSPYNLSSMRPVLDCPSTLTDGVDSNSRVFYDYEFNEAEIGSGVVRMTLTNSAGTTQVGYVVETGTAPSGSVGAQTLAETSLLYAMRTFLDGGQMAATNMPGHIVQIPLVKIFLANTVPQYSESQTIAFTVASPVTATTASGGLTVGQPVTNIWWRFNPGGVANYYTEEYPNYGGNMTGTGMYQEAVSVIYNLKYSPNGGVTWAFLQDDSAAVTGVCDSSTAHAVTTLAPWTYDWPVSTGTRVLSQGDYLLMVETYRQNYGLHYAYDISDLEINW